MLSGTPTAAGTASFTVNVTDTAGATLSQGYTLTVNPALSIAPADAAGGHRGGGDQPDHHRVERHPALHDLHCLGLRRRQHRADGGESDDRRGGGNGDALRHADGGRDGDLHGQRHRHGGATLTQTYTLTVNPALSIAPATLAEATAGTATNQTITVSNGTTPYTTFTVSGFSAGGTGLTAGEPDDGCGGGNGDALPARRRAAGTASFTVNVTDTAGATLTKPYTLTVNPALAHRPGGAGWRPSRARRPTRPSPCRTAPRPTRPSTSRTSAPAAPG